MMDFSFKYNLSWLTFINISLKTTKCKESLPELMWPLNLSTHSYWKLSRVSSRSKQLHSQAKGFGKMELSMLSWVSVWGILHRTILMIRVGFLFFRIIPSKSTFTFQTSLIHETWSTTIIEVGQNVRKVVDLCWEIYDYLYIRKTKPFLHYFN